MPTYNIVGDDTLTLFGRILGDFADGDISTFTFDNDRVTSKTGKNGNTIFAENQTGKNCKSTLRLMIGSSDDVFLQSQLTASDQDFASTTLGTGQFVKNLGDGAGNKVRNVFTLNGGMITRTPDGKSNVEGSTDQGVAVYNMFFAQAIRSIE